VTIPAARRRQPAEQPVAGNGAIGALAGAEQIYILPSGWVDAEWWTDVQLDNLRTVLDTVKRTYNVDENRVVLSGVSDGGTAAYYGPCTTRRRSPASCP
jgi:predicted peptidase